MRARTKRTCDCGSEGELENIYHHEKMVPVFDSETTGGNLSDNVSPSICSKVVQAHNIIFRMERKNNSALPQHHFKFNRALASSIKR